MKKIIDNIKDWDWERIVCVVVVALLGIVFFGCIALCVFSGQVKTGDYKPQARVIFINGRLTVLFF